MAEVHVLDNYYLAITLRILLLDSILAKVRQTYWWVLNSPFSPPNMETKYGWQPWLFQTSQGAQISLSLP